MDPAEAVAHLVAHDVRAPIFLAAELLRMTVDDARDDGEIGDVTGRLEAIIDGLQAAGTMCDDVVASLRPKPGDADTTSVAALAEAAWPDCDVVVTGRGDEPALLRDVVRDLALIAPAPTRVRIEVGDPAVCQVRAGGIEDTRDACLALARAARRVGALELRGGDFRVGRDGNEFVIDVRFPRGVDRQ